MWIYEKRLIYPLGDIRPNPRMAKLTAMLLGGPNGEFTAATTYLNQRYCMPCGAVQAILTDIGTEELSHVEMLSVMIQKMLAGASKEELRAAGMEGWVAGIQTARLHTATHLLLAGLKKILSPDIQQRGSNITAERLRFDFNFPRPVTKEELAQVEAFVNQAISEDVPVVCQEMSVDQAKQEGATGIFESKYGDVVKVYTVEGWSKEICGGPHASHTGELGHFKIKKEQSSSAGVRRIKAVLEGQEE